MAFPNVTRGFFNFPVAVGLSLIFCGSLAAVVYVSIYGLSWLSFALACVLMSLALVGVTNGYHRLYTHNSFSCSRGMQRFLTIAAGLGPAGPAKQWCPDHSQHHAHTDKQGDPHSPWTYTNADGTRPSLKGFLWSHVVWVLFGTRRPSGYAPYFRWANDPIVIWQAKWNWLIVTSGFLIPALVCGFAGMLSSGLGGLIQGSIEGLLVCGFLRAGVFLNVMWSVNSVTHIWGRRVVSEGCDPADQSRNNLLVALLSAGEGYHGNHHETPNCAWLGRRWYDFDPGKWFLVLAGLAGWVWDIRTPNGLLFARTVLTEKKAAT